MCLYFSDLFFNPQTDFPLWFQYISLLFFLCFAGIEDLKSGKIVTPLPPKDTFMEDPLRVLRAIRFGTCHFILEKTVLFGYSSLRNKKKRVPLLRLLPF